MSKLEENTASLQELLNIANTLPEAGSVETVSGRLTTGIGEPGALFGTAYYLDGTGTVQTIVGGYNTIEIKAVQKSSLLLWADAPDWLMEKVYTNAELIFKQEGRNSNLATLLIKVTGDNFQVT